MIEAALGRLGAMKTDLLTEAFFVRMMGAESVPKAAEMLIGSTYELAVHRVQGAPGADLEHALWQEVFAMWTRLAKFLEGSRSDLAVSFIRTYEVDNIRRIVRRVLADTQDDLSPGLWDIGRLGALDIDRLERARTMLAVREAVARSPYSSIFDLAEHRLVEGEPLFAFEQVLQAGYLDILLASARSVRGAIGASARAYIERRVHFTNVRWALRLRFGRAVPKEDVPQYLVRESQPADSADIKSILASENIVDAARHLKRVLPHRSFAKSSVRECDRALRQELALWSRHEMRAQFFQFASLFAYFDVRAQEVRNIAAVLVGLQQGRSVDEIRERLGIAA